MKQGNGNSQINESRERQNDRTDKLRKIGTSKGQKWRRRRRYRSI
jgi:hypothetical protein